VSYFARLRAIGMVLAVILVCATCLRSPAPGWQDAYGNTATGYTGTVHFTSSDAKAALPPRHAEGPPAAEW